MKSKFATLIGNLALITIFFLYTNNANAQWHPIIGVKGGLNVDNVTGSAVLGTNMGGYAALEYGDVWGVNLEAFYAERHWQGGDEHPTIRLSYLEMPLYVNYFFLRKYTTIRPKIVFGPSFNFLLESEKQAINPATMEIGAIIGLGFNKDLTRDGNITMFFDARYMQGFTPTQSIVAGEAAYNKTLRFHIGFGFSLTGGRNSRYHNRRG